MSYSVSAVLYSEETNCYTDDTWEAGTFESYNEAYAKWDEWWPPMDEVKKACREDFKLVGGSGHYEIEIGVWDEDGNNEDFYNETVNWWE